MKKGLASTGFASACRLICHLTTGALVDLLSAKTGLQLNEC